MKPLTLPGLPRSLALDGWWIATLDPRFAAPANRPAPGFGLTGLASVPWCRSRLNGRGSG